MRFFQFLFYTPLLPDLMRFLKNVLNSKFYYGKKQSRTYACIDWFFFWIWIIWCLFSQLLKLLSHLIFKSLVRNFVVFADVRSYNPCEDLILLWPAVVLFLSDDPSRIFFLVKMWLHPPYCHSALNFFLKSAISNAF